MSRDFENLDDVIRRASEANAAEPIRELTDDEMDRVSGAARLSVTQQAGAPGGASGWRIPIWPSFTKVSATSVCICGSTI